MIEQYGGVYIPTCDHCGEELPEEWYFQDAVDAMKAEGWRIEPPGGLFDKWTHYCPTCSAKFDFEN